ncbi:hypothetical protein GE061_018044 [Apolygus lucorum]|uniref:Uncharacterized protein n=1 Tax=Apolygus lucorum TaxID=248454 RepID=A0A8S9XEV6_APOLU|nr:hypothetical protein GE061_018044 [Apolygus lucorum]
MVFLCVAAWIITLTDLGNPIRKYNRGTTFYLEYFVYYSNISLTLYMVTVSFGAFFITMKAYKYKFGRPVPTDKVCRFRKVYWKLHQMKSMVALSVTTAYWLIVHPVSDYPLDLNNFLAHVTNSALALFDFAVTGLPYNFSVVWIGWIYSTCYIVLTYIYWTSGGYARPSPFEEHSTSKVLYKNCTDWGIPGRVFACFLGFIFSMSMWHVLTTALNRIRLRWWKERPEDMKGFKNMPQE